MNNNKYDASSNKAVILAISLGREEFHTTLDFSSANLKACRTMARNFLMALTEMHCCYYFTNVLHLLQQICT